MSIATIPSRRPDSSLRPKPQTRMPSLLMASTVPVTLRAFLAPLARHFRSLGWRVDAMARDVSGSSECLTAFDRCWDVPWSRTPWNPRNLLQAVPEVREIVAREGYDLVHVHTPVAGFVTRFALRHRAHEGQPKVIYTAHGFHFYRGGPPVRNAIYRGLEKVAGRWTDALVVMNREDESAAHHHGLIPPERLRFMHGIGVDTAEYASRGVRPVQVERLQEELRLPPFSEMLLMVAELIPRKRPDDVIRALSRMEHRHAQLIIAGTGPLRGGLARLAGELSIADRVHFLGFRRDIPVLLRASRALVLASEHEGLPRSIMEAMCMETPVIGARIRGIEDLLDDGCGFLVEKGDVDGLARAMDRVLEEPDDARAAALKARAKMGLYDLQGILRDHEALYRDVLSGSHQGGGT
jgi:glycosyltransferase involved in cell wall biosynthesis